MRTHTKTRHVPEQVTERLQVAGDRAKETAGVARERAAEASELARERATEAAHAVEPVVRTVGDKASSAAKTLLTILLPLPAVLAKVLGLLSNVTGGLVEHGRELADRVEPPAAAKRRSKLRTGLWFLGGFGAGAATGWVLHARTHEEAVPADLGYGDPDGSPYGEEARSIDARRAQRDLG